MKLNQKHATVQTNFTSTDGANLDIDKEDIGVVIGYLSDDIYSNAIGSIVREYTSNAYDAHKEAGQKRPVRVIISDDNIGKYFAVQDLGTGMDKETIMTYFKKYGKSSRRETNETLGAFGLGSKCFASYSDAVYYTTVKDGTEYAFALFKSDPTPRFEFIHETKTFAPNGTTVKIYIKSHDVPTFKSEIRRQLAYFDNVYFDVSGVGNKYKVFHYNNFAYISYPNGLEWERQHDNMHILLGNVAYPLNMEEISPLIVRGKADSWGLGRIPIALKFDIGELPITISREQVKYNVHSRKLIYERLKMACSELTQMLNDNRKNYETVLDYFISHTSKLHQVALGLDIVDITQAVRFCGDNNCDVKLAPIQVANGKYGNIDWEKFSLSRFAYEFTSSLSPESYINGQSARFCKYPHLEKPNNTALGNFYKRHIDNGTIYQLDSESIADKNKVMVHDTGWKDVLFVVKKPIVIKGTNNIGSLCDVFNIKAEPDKIPGAIQVLEQMRDDILSEIPTYSSVNIDEDRIKKIKKEFFQSKSVLSRDTSNAIIYVLREKERSWRSHDYCFQKHEVKDTQSELSSYKYIICGVKGTDDHKVKELARPHSNIRLNSRMWNESNTLDALTKMHIKLIAASSRTIDKLKSQLTNVFTIEEFVKSKYYKDMAEAYLVRSHIHKELHELYTSTRIRMIEKLLDPQNHERVLQNKMTDLMCKFPTQFPFMFVDNSVRESIKIPNAINKEIAIIKEIYNTFDFLEGVYNNDLGLAVARAYMEQNNINYKL